MIDSFVQLSVPTQAATGWAIAGLLILLIASQLVDYESSPFRFVVRYLGVFTAPLLVLFAFVVVIRVVVIIGLG